MHLLDATAWCEGCDWKTEGKNAMGNAARHHKKTGHFVMVELYYSQCFGESLVVTTEPKDIARSVMGV